MISRIGDAKSIRCFRRGQHGKSSPRRRTDQKPFRRPEDLKPDLILLDIGLPKLSGIEAARRIRQVSPGSKIIFLSQYSDLEFVRAALGTGALGYVQKTDAGRELLPAVAAVLRGKKFVSSSLRGHEFSASPGEEKAPHRHEVLFYSDDTDLLDRVSSIHCCGP